MVVAGKVRMAEGSGSMSCAILVRSILFVVTLVGQTLNMMLEK